MNKPAIISITSKLGLENISENNKGWLLYECPFAPWFHKNGRDNNPDFWIKTEPSGFSGFHCFACKQHGSLYSLVKKLERRRQVSYGTLAIDAATAECPSDFGKFEIDEDIYEPTPIDDVIYIGMYPLAWESDESRLYLLGRKVSQRTSEKLGLVYDEDERRILFPVRNHEKQLFGFSGRTTIDKEENYPYKKYPKVRDCAGLPKEKVILGEEHWEKGKPIWIVEGLFAYALAMERGFDKLANIGATLGSVLSIYQRDILISYNCPVYLCYDQDLAGDLGLFGPWNEQKEIFEGGGAIDKLKKHVPTFLPIYPDGIDDPDNLTFEHFEKMLKFDFKLC